MCKGIPEARLPQSVTTLLALYAGPTAIKLIGMRINAAVACAVVSVAAVVQADVVRLDELPLDQISQDWGDPHANKSVEANEITIGGQRFEHGLGTHAEFFWMIDLDGKAERFTASVGIDDEIKRDPAASRVRVEFKVIGDNGKVLAKSGRLGLGDAAKKLDAELAGQKSLRLVVEAENGDINYAHVDWADATITFAGVRPSPRTPPREPREILTPPAPPTPRINGASVFGVRPTHPILYTIAATGERPMTFAAEGLPEGATLDEKTGRLGGSVAKAGTYEVTLRATNARGAAHRKFKLIVGDKLALTPPMGWNSWYCYGLDVSDEKVRAAADAMIKTGLADHGWSYINIDDGWTISSKTPRPDRRNSDGSLRTNEKFPDMKALADYVHSKGLRVGTYSSPGELTCGQHEGTLDHEASDARQYAEWGFDLLKYDWCSYGRVVDGQLRTAADARTRREIHKHPYDVMHAELIKQPRDIIYSLCQYGDDRVWEWGADAGGQLWRTTGDITDSWRAMSNIGFGQAGHEKYAGPGRWNDPDMLLVGKLALGKLRDSKLTPNEQYTQVTLWSLLSAPLLISGDMTQFDDFSLGLLTNDEVIAVNQDPLGEQAHRVRQDKEMQTEVWAKRLEDGSMAVGLFNRDEEARKVKVSFDELGLAGPQQIRDLWRQKEAQASADGYEVEIPRHGTSLIRISARP